MRATYDSLLPAVCVPAAELVQQAHSDVSVSGGVKYLLLDIREKRQWENGHIATAVHVNPTVLFTRAATAQLIADYSHLKGQHICLLGNDMRTYTQLADIAQAAVDRSPDTTAAQPLLDAFLAAIRDTGTAEVEQHRMYLTPRELLAMEKEDRRREEARKWRLGAGAAPPIAALISKDKAISRSPSPAQPPPSLPTPPTVPDSPAAGATTPPIAASSASSAAATADSAASADAAPAAEAELVYSFPATSPLMDPYTASFVHLFLENGFSHVSVCDGGYYACHELIMSYKKQQEQQKKTAPTAAAPTTATPPAAASSSTASSAATATAPGQTIELVDHVPCQLPVLLATSVRDVARKQAETAARSAEKGRGSQAGGRKEGGSREVGSRAGEREGSQG